MKISESQQKVIPEIPDVVIVQRQDSIVHTCDEQKMSKDSFDGHRQDCQ